ncbi:MAG: AAA family ATPase [Candidatus Binatia bacterium]|nr:AAA family ATPase [Candidatus Binatia bacterium]
MPRKLAGKDRTSKPGVFVGRKALLDRFDANLRQVRSGQGRFISVIGAPGIGKATLVQNVCARAREQGLRVAQSRCQERTAAHPFWAWTQILRDLPDTQYATRIEAFGAARSGHASERSDAPFALAHANDEARLELFDEISGFIQRTALQQPLVCVFENVQWADKASALLLGFAARELARVPLLLLSTHDSADADADAADRSLDSIRSWSHEHTREEIHLEGLDPTEARTFVGHVAGRIIPESEMAPLVANAGGNPLFLREAARDHLDGDRGTEGTTAHDPPRGETRHAGSPEDYHSLVLQRVARLEAATRHLLKAAAIVGERFEVSMVSKMLGQNTETLLEHAAVIAALDEACVADLTQPVPGKLTHYQFTHSLIRKALCRAMQPSERRELHRRAVLALESETDANSELHLTQLASHSYECALAGEAVRAGRYNHRAAQRAEKLLAFDEAALFYDRTIEAHRLHAPKERREFGGLLLQAGSAHGWAGGWERSREIFEEALAIGRDLQDDTIFCWATLGTLGPWHIAGPVNERTVERLEEALARTPLQESLLRMHLVSRLAGELRFCGRAARGEELTRDMLARARQSGDRDLLAHCCSLARFGIWGPKNLEERLAVATEGLELCHSVPSRFLEFASRLWKAIDLLESARCREAWAEIDCLQSIAQESRTPALVWQSRIFSATKALLRGDFAAAEQIANDALSVGMRANLSDAPILHGVFRFQFCWLRGTLDELETAITMLVNLDPGHSAWRAGMAMMYLETDRRGQAREQLALFMSDGLDTIEDTPAYLGALTLAGEVSVGLRDAEVARTLYDELVPYAGRLVVLGNATACHGAVDSLLGALADVAGRDDDAEGHFASGLELESRLDAAPLTTKTRLAWGLWLAKEDPAQARELLARSARDAEALGMVRIRDAARAALDRLRAAHETGESAPGNTSAPKTLEARATIRRTGDYWTIRTNADEIQIKDSKGLAYLTHLLRHPQREFPSIELLELTDPTQRTQSSVPDRRRPIDDALSGIDTTAIDSYRNRLRALRAERDEAEENNDIGREAALQSEIEFLAQELAQALGPGGRPRRAGSDVERARLNVTRAIKRAIERIQEGHPALGRSLSATIRTGNLCSYEPDPDRPLTWDA